MITRQTFISKLDNLDWGFFDKDYPAIAFLIRCSEDYEYVNNIAKGKINADNDARMKVAGQIIKKGIEFIPVVGDILTMIADIGGIDFGAFGSISDSGTARQRLFDWITWINNNYTVNKFGIYDLPNLNQRFTNATYLLIKNRPKCLSPTTNCSKEHQQYIARTSLLKESQQSLYDIYYNYCVNDYVFTSWLQGVKDYNRIKNSDVNSVQTPTFNSKLLLLLGASLFFSKKF